MNFCRFPIYSPAFLDYKNSSAYKNDKCKKSLQKRWENVSKFGPQKIKDKERKQNSQKILPPVSVKPKWVGYFKYTVYIKAKKSFQVH